MDWLIQLVISTPETVLVVAVTTTVTALGTLLGVAVTARYHAKHQVAQNEFVRALKQDEFKADLRHSTYLSVAAELVDAQTFLVNMGNLSAEEWSANSSLTSFGRVLNQAILVADDQTALLLTGVLSAYQRAFFNLIKLVIPIQEAITERNIFQETVEQHTNEIHRLTLAMVKNAEKAERDIEEWEAIQRIVAVTQSMQTDQIAKLRVAQERLQTLQESYMGAAMSESQQVADLIVSALVAVRRELGLQTDEGALRERVEVRYRQSIEELSRFTSELQRNASRAS